MSRSAILLGATQRILPAARSRDQGRRAALPKEGLKVTFVNTSLLKFTWPGTEPVRRRPETPEAREKRIAAEKIRWDNRMQDAQQRDPLRADHGLRQGSRLHRDAHRKSGDASIARIAETIGGEMAAVAEKEKVYLLIENEGSQNVGTARSSPTSLKLISSKWVGLQLGPAQRLRQGDGLSRGVSASSQEAAVERAGQGEGHHAGEPRKRRLEGHHAGAR